MQIFSSEKIPIMCWAGEVEPNCLEQAKNLANLPYAFHHIALMPDVHFGMGIPIGGILAAKNVVVPNAVGTDIGCSVSAYRVNTTIENFSKELLKEIMGDIRKVFPVGEARYPPKDKGVVKFFEKLENVSEIQNEDLKSYLSSEQFKTVYLRQDTELKRIIRKMFECLPSMGGGNHFLEIQKENNETGNIWIMTHFGSRGLGAETCRKFNNIARKINEEHGCPVPDELKLSGLALDSQAGKEYWDMMTLSLQYARLNHLFTKEILRSVLRDKGLDFLDEHFIHHNYAAKETHFGEEVVVHRKGATSAKLDELGIIPGSMGTSSYLVKGLGEPNSYMSCSHGAGRKFGRAKAMETLDLAEEIAKMEKLGVVHGLRNKNDLEEADGAYKNIKDVLAEEQDLVKVVLELKPLGVIKG
ncbi:MAG: RtcB family protein [Spirochaetaceae bacterium]|nr:RtcB family protein [Spirochaetaceae bacterium]